MTNFEKFKLMPIEELAEYNVHEAYQYYTDYAFDGVDEYMTSCIEDGYKTSDGSFFTWRDDAVEYEIEWLEKEVEE